MKFYERNGILYVRINGKRLSTKLEDTPKNRKLVTSYYKNDEFLNKFNVISDDIPTVLTLCEEVLKEKELTVKSSTLRAYFALYKSRIIPYFDKVITHYKPKHIELFYKQFKDKQSILTCEAVLKPAFEKAILRGYINYTPFIISKPRLKSNYVIKPFTVDEIKMILNYQRDDFFINYFAIAIFTGLRSGELLALKWSDIDFVNNTISINRTFTGGFESTPKTLSSRAVIDLPIEALEYFKLQQIKNGLREYIFYNKQGKLIKTTHNLNRILRTVLKDLNLPDRCIYQTRHTFASIKLSFGERLEWVSFMLRHKDTSLTLRKYYKYMPNKHEKRVVINFDDLAQKQHS